MTPLMLTAVAGAALLIGMSKGGLVAGGPLLTILLSLAMPSTVAIGVLLPLLIVGDLFALWAHWGRWDAALLVRLLPGGVIGVAGASLWLSAISERALQLVLVVATVLFLVHRALGSRLTGIELQVRTGNAAVAGAVSGVTSTVAHVGGPPIAIYLLATRTPARVYVATSVAFFAVVNWLKVPGYVGAGLLDATTVRQVAPAMVLIPPGVLIGRWGVQRMSQRVFDRMILVSLLAGALLLLLE